MPLAAEHRGIVSSGSPFWMAALRMAGPMPARQHGQRAQMRFAGSVQHVSAEKPCQMVTQAKAGGSLPHIHNTLNQSSDSESCDAGVLHEDISGPHMLAILAPSGRYPFRNARSLVTDPASGAIAVESTGSTVSRSLRSIAFGWPRHRQDVPMVGREKGGCEPRGPHSVPGIRAFARYCASLCQNSAQSSLGAT